MTQQQPPAAGTEPSSPSRHRYGRSSSRGSGGVVVAAGLVALAIVGYAISWGWTQRSSAHSEQVLEAQRGGYQSAELRFCLGIEQVAGGVGRAEAALAARNAHDLKLAVSSIQAGYVTAKGAAKEVPHASVHDLTAPRNSVKAARDRAPDGLPAVSVIGPPLHDLALAASAASTDAVCGHVLSIGRKP